MEKTPTKMENNFGVFAIAGPSGQFSDIYVEKPSGGLLSQS